jgi:GrpB-like predicted nucleotidyltransferase (UPF0157 family)
MTRPVTGGKAAVPDAVRILDYDPGWPELFRALAERVRTALGSAVIAVEHVGSTAVPGLVAKPVIDLDIVVLPQNFRLAIERLASLGYAHEGDRGVVGREAFRWPAGEGRHHLYLCAPDSPALRDHLLFRDYLRAHPETARAYADLKLELARRNVDDRTGYQSAKSGFVEAVTRQAAEALPDGSAGDGQPSSG